MEHDVYRPATYNVLHAGLDASGVPTTWTHRSSEPSLFIPRKRPLPPNGVDPTAVEGAANMPYAIPNPEVDWIFKDYGIPVGFWRSVSASQNAFIVESFVAELAHAPRREPLEYLRTLLSKSPLHRGVLEKAAKEAGWDTPRPRGRARGIAVAFSYGSYAAEVAEVSLAPDGKVRVHRVVCAIDTGLAVQSESDQSAGGGRRHLRSHGRPLRAITIRQGTSSSVQLPRLPDAAHRRDAEDRGASVPDIRLSSARSP